MWVLRLGRFFSVVLCLLPTPVLGGAPLSPASVSASGAVTLEVIQCPRGRTENPQLSIASAADYPNLRYVAVDVVSVEHVDNGYYKVTASVPQGNYFFQVRSNHCSNYLQAAVLTSHTRLLSLALETRSPASDKSYVKLFDSENSVAGTLAVHPSVGWIVAASGASRVLDLQDGAYYIERVLPGKYSLRFELHGSLQSEIPLDLSDVSSTQLFHRDVDASTFRKNIGLISAHGGTLKDCSYCY